MLKNRICTLSSLALLVIAGAVVMAHAQTYTDLYNFDGTHGSYPQVPGLLAQGRNGNLYGTTKYGGIGAGVVFSTTPSGTMNVLYTFDGTDGWFPYSGLTLGIDGNFYGTTEGNSQYGTIFKITGGGALSNLYTFTNGTDGAHPEAPPIQGMDKNFYGTTGSGTAYKVTSSGTFTLLGSLGGSSFTPLLQGTDGNFYGITDDGGSAGSGAVFKMTSKGVVTIVHSFDVKHGANPTYLIQGSDGNFYGSTADGGSNGYGVLFKLTPKGSFTVLHSFPDPNYPSDGISPAGLVQATDGSFYGVTTSGGNVGIGYGVIFKITSTGNYSILYNFDSIDGANPLSIPMQHTNGKIYGLTSGGGTTGSGTFYSLDVGLGPFVTFLPAQSLGKVGASIGIFGQSLTGTTGVAFGGTPATYTLSSSTYLTAKIPSGALSGSVTVTTPGGTLTSNRTFRVTPQITSFSPLSGQVGTLVTITGVSLTQTTKVAFGVNTATFAVISDAQVTATVPTGAVTGKILITTSGGTATSSTSFTVTP